MLVILWAESTRHFVHDVLSIQSMHWHLCFQKATDNTGKEWCYMLTRNHQREGPTSLLAILLGMITETVYRRHLCPGVWQSCFVISRSVTNLVPFWRLVILANSLSSIGTWICYVEKYIVEDTYLMLAHRKWHTLCKASTVWLSSSHCRSSCLLLQCSSCCCYQDWWKAWIQKLRRYVVFTVIFSLFVRWWDSKLCLMMQEVGKTVAAW